MPIAEPKVKSAVAAVLFDYGLVLTGPPSPAAWERMKRVVRAQEPEFHAAYWRHRHRYDLGAFSASAYWHAVAADLGRDLGCDLGCDLDEAGLGELIAQDSALWTEPNRPMIAWAAELQQRGVRTGILSNLGDAMETGVLRACPWMNAFAHSTFTHRIGVAKPEPGAYLHAIQGLGVPAGDILFIDDRAENVAGAEAAGLRAIRYGEHASFVRTLEQLGYAEQLGVPALL